MNRPLNSILTSVDSLINSQPLNLNRRQVHKGVRAYSEVHYNNFSIPSKFTVLNRKNGGCPVCGESKGNCRQSGDLILCIVAHSEVTGYHFKGESRDRLWGIHIPIDRDNPQRHYTKAPLPTGNKLSVIERDRAIRSIIQQLPLSPEHRKDLERRGLTDFSEFVSIGSNSCLDTPVTSDLAGMAVDGRHFAIAPGYLIPIKNIDGKYVGFQVRTANTENKYRWLKSRINRNRTTEATSHLPNGELPLQHCLVANARDLNLSEGTLKPIVASYKHQVSFIGGSGGRFPDEQLRTAVERIKPDRVILCPDAGSRVNQNVLGAYQTLANQLKVLGQELLVRDWGQSDDKTALDVDEIDSDTFNKAKIISFDEWGKDAEIKLKLKQWNTYTPDIILNEQYLTGGNIFDKIYNHFLDTNSDKSDSAFVGYLKNSILAIKSPLGSNKTGSLAEYLQYLELVIHYKSFLIYSDINHLLQQTVARFNEMGLKLSHPRFDGELLMIKDCYANLAACLQSIHLWKKEDFPDRVVAIDEWMSVARSFIDGETFKAVDRNQTESTIRAAFKNSDCLILLDGNMNDESVKLAQAVSDKRVIKIENIPPEPRKYNLNLINERADLITRYLDSCLQQSEKINILGSDNASELEGIYRSLLDLGINSKDVIFAFEGSTKEQCPPEFRANPSLFLLKNPHIKYILYSPTLGKGFDLDGELIKADIHLFNNPFYLFDGILAVDAIDQMVFRNRDEMLTRNIYIAEKGKARITKNQYSYHLKQHYEALIANWIADSPKEQKSVMNHIKDGIWTVFENNPFRQFDEKWREVQKYQDENLRECAIDFFRAKGYGVTVDGDNAPETAQTTRIETALSTAKATIKAETLAKIAKDIELTIAAPESVEILKQWESTREESDPPIEVKAYHVTKRESYEKALPGLTTSAHWNTENLTLLEENPALLSGLTARVMLGDISLAKKEASRRVAKMVESYRQWGSVWLGDFKTDLSKIFYLRDLGVMDFVRTHQETAFSWESKAVAQILKKAMKLGLIKRQELTAANTVKLLGILLKWCGYKPVRANADNKSRTYLISDSFDIAPELRSQLMDSIKKRLAAQPEIDLTDVLKDSEKISGAHEPLLYRNNSADLPLTSGSIQGFEGHEVKKPEFTEIKSIPLVTEVENVLYSEGKSRSGYRLSAAAVATS